jgi:hypothetical protein
MRDHSLTVRPSEADFSGVRPLRTGFVDWTEADRILEVGSERV